MFGSRESSLEVLPCSRFAVDAVCFLSVESVTPVDDFTLLVGLDTNYPGGNGRVPGTPDDTEIITLRSNVPLKRLRVDQCKRRGDDDEGGTDHHCQ
jgi:hypothetical protein